VRVLGLALLMLIFLFKWLAGIRTGRWLHVLISAIMVVFLLSCFLAFFSCLFRCGSVSKT
jgi:hypothetical protein